MNRPDNSKQKRRQLIKLITSAGGTAVIAKSLPQNWTAPLVESVSLPAHAGLSTINGSFGAFDFSDGLVVDASPLDLLVTKAYAGGVSAMDILDICMAIDGGLIVQLQVTYQTTPSSLFPKSGVLPISIEDAINSGIPLNTDVEPSALSGEVQITSVNGSIKGAVLLEDMGGVTTYSFSFTANTSPCAFLGP